MANSATLKFGEFERLLAFKFTDAADFLRTWRNLQICEIFDFYFLRFCRFLFCRPGKSTSLNLVAGFYKTAVKFGQICRFLSFKIYTKPRHLQNRYGCALTSSNQFSSHFTIKYAFLWGSNLRETSARSSFLSHTIIPSLTS